MQVVKYLTGNPYQIIIVTLEMTTNLIRLISTVRITKGG